jgi:tetratricopeptide (TPR) repeat protein
MKRHLSFVAALGICVFAANTHAQQIKSETGSVAIGGSVTSSTIIIGIPQEKVDELVRDAKRPLEELTTSQRENIALLKEKLDLNVGQVRAALGILGENDIAPERLAAKLVEIAERFKDLQATASARPGDDPKIATLKTDAQKAIEAGDLAKADALLADVETEQRRALDRLALNAAETATQRGEIALTRLRYAEAAKHFANAAGALPTNSAHEDKRRDYLSRETAALFLQGKEFGDNNALRSAIERYIRLIDLNPRERMPLEWAVVQNDLGMALWVLGDREAGTAKLEEAVVAFREALKELPRERVPLDWATNKNNLGVVLLSLGERESGTAKLQEAVVAFREALTERTRERVPLDWAATQNNLAGALLRLGSRGNGNAMLEESVIAYRGAINEMTRERGPLQWATIQNNLGSALLALGDREAGTAKLEEAVVAFREALKERTRERVPLDWAATQYNLGSALWATGRRGGDAAISGVGITVTMEDGLIKVVAPIDETPAAKAGIMANDIITHLDDDPVQGLTLNQAVEKMRGPEHSKIKLAIIREGQNKPIEISITRARIQLAQAAVAFREALKEMTRERGPIQWASAKVNLGTVLQSLGKLEEAIAAHREALEVFTRETLPLNWALVQHNLGVLLVMIGQRESDTAKFEQAVAAFQGALKERTVERVPLDRALSLCGEGMARVIMAERQGAISMAESGLGQMNEAFETARDGGNAQNAAACEGMLSEARTSVMRLRGGADQSTAR